MGAVVVVNGWYRTGSTLCFYTVQRILAARGLPFRAVGQDFAPADRMIDEHLARTTGEWLVVKSHNWLPSVDNQDRVITLYTKRQPADIMRSAMKLIRRHRAAAGGMDADAADAADANAINVGASGLVWLLMFYRYMLPRLPMHVIEYEEFYGKPRQYVVHVAGLLGLSLTEAEIQTVMSAIDVERVKGWTDRLDGPADAQSQFRKSLGNARSARWLARRPARNLPDPDRKGGARGRTRQPARRPLTWRMHGQVEGSALLPTINRRRASKTDRRGSATAAPTPRPGAASAVSCRRFPPVA